MFTGIIENKGKIIENRPTAVGRHLSIQLQEEALKEGESIAINGVCLTLLPNFNQVLSFNVSPETLSKTNLAHLTPGEEVNIERAMLANTRFGGHYVTGHVDTTITLLKKQTIGEYIEFTIGDFSTDALRFLPNKGSVALEGVSLTINEVMGPTIKLMLIPHTLQKTNLGKKEIGDFLNIEFDYITKIVANSLNILMPPSVEVNP